MEAGFDMAQMDIGDILQDLRSVKLRTSLREYVDRARESFQSNGDLPAGIKIELRKICSRYNKQLKELYVSRERAKHTNGLRKMGLTRDEAQDLVKKRRVAKLRSENEVGF